MTVHRAVIHSPGKLRELARKDRLKRCNHRAQRLSNLALLSDWLGVPVGLIVDSSVLVKESDSEEEKCLTPQ